MRNYIIRRIFWMIPVLILISIMVFALMRFIPGDAALLMVAGGENVQSDPEVYNALRHKLGLDRPYWVQYTDWVYRIVRYGDMGTSFWTEEPVALEIIRRLPVTLELALGTIAFSLTIALPTGIVSAIRQDTGTDYVARIIGIIGLAAPGFWIGTLLIVFPAIWFGYMPPLGYTPPQVDLWRNFKQFVFPCLAMGAHQAATIMRMTRSQMLEVLRQDYIRTAWSKGLRERVVIYRHALKNAMIPVVTIVGVDLGYLLGRTVIMETVFALPGIGTLTLRSIYQRDYPQIQGNILWIAGMFVVINLIVDIVYAWIDPRIRYQ